MPRLKSHSGAKKRLRKTGSGKLVFKRNSRNHLLMQKSRKQKRLPRVVVAQGRDVKRLLPLVIHL